MGNTESNTRQPNYKIYRIIRVDEEKDYTRCYLDDYVPYRNGNRKHIDFENDKISEFLDFGTMLSGMGSRIPILAEGWYIKVSIDYTRERNSYDNFSKRSVSNVMVSERGDNSLLQLVAAAGDFGNETSEIRQRYEQMVEQARFERGIRE